MDVQIIADPDQALGLAVARRIREDLAWLARRGLKADIPTWGRRTNPQPRAPERYQARHAVERGLGWLKW